MQISAVLEKLILKKNLSQAEAFESAKEILGGTLTHAQTAALLTALRAKGEAVDEIAGFVLAMRDSMTKIVSARKIIVDTCGTGGDSKGTFNISTAAAFIVAGAGFTVAKHGNRSVSSACGSADLLEACGVKIDISKEKAEKILEEIGIVFLFAPHYHPAMKNVAPVRKELGIRTLFNLLGPLANPASANAQVIGVSNKGLVGTISKVLQKVSAKSGSCFIVLNEDGHDELILNGKEAANEIFKGKIRSISLKPKNFGLKKASVKALKGGDAKVNAQIIFDVLSGKNSELGNVLIANAALAIFCAQKAEGDKKSDLKSAAAVARNSLLSGAALEKLKRLAEASRS